MIGDALEKLGMTQAELAEQTGISTPTISRICHGAVIAAEHAVKISKVLDIPLHKLRPDLWPAEAAAK